MKKIIVILLPLLLAIMSAACTGLYVSNHKYSFKPPTDTQNSVSHENIDRVPQSRLAENDSKVETYHIFSIAFAFCTVVAALISCASNWYEGLHPRMMIFRSLNLIAGLGSLLLSMIRI